MMDNTNFLKLVIVYLTIADMCHCMCKVLDSFLCAANGLVNAGNCIVNVVENLLPVYTFGTNIISLVFLHCTINSLEDIKEPSMVAGCSVFLCIAYHYLLFSLASRGLNRNLNWSFSHPAKELKIFLGGGQVRATHLI